MNIRRAIRYFGISDWVVYLLKIRRWGYLDVCPTWKCNAKCPTCSSWKRERSELSKAQVEQLATSKHFKYIGTVFIEGGEPTLWTHLEYFVRLFLDNHRYTNINIITNGFNSERIARFVQTFEKDKKRIKFYLSFNGDKKTHDESRGVERAYERALESAKIIYGAGYFIQFSSVTFDQNIDQADHVFKIAEQYGGRVNFCWPSISGRFANDGEWTTNRKEEIKTVLNRQTSRLSLFDRLASDYYVKKSTTGKLMPCYAGYRYVHINPQGILRPCLFDESMAFGKVKNTGVDLYNFKATVKGIPEKCQYTDGSLCDDCLIRRSIRSNPLKYIGGKLWSRL